ncbi:MAG: hypothetical protein JNN30_17690 [Rhodanobacteraceae bacterium]|nr:hypothetical protein [Rhodanobacteraceae bacterium]
MATELQRLEIGGQTIWVEVGDSIRPAPGNQRSSTDGGIVRTSAGGTALTAAAVVLAQADITHTLSALITPIHAALAQIRPEEVAVELSLGLKGEVGVFVAKSEANAALKITAKWKFTQGQPPPDPVSPEQQ